MIRKDFTVSERVAIAQAVEAEIGNRQGERTDTEPPHSCAEVSPGTETRDIAAKEGPQNIAEAADTLGRGRRWARSRGRDRWGDSEQGWRLWGVDLSRNGSIAKT